MQTNAEPFRFSSIPVKQRRRHRRWIRVPRVTLRTHRIGH